MTDSAPAPDRGVYFPATELPSTAATWLGSAKHGPIANRRVSRGSAPPRQPEFTGPGPVDIRTQDKAEAAMNRMGGIVRQVVHRPTPSRAMAFDLLREMCPCPRAQGELDRLEAETGAAIVVRISGVSRVTAASSIAIELRQLVAELVWTRNSLDISCPGGSGPTIMHLLGPGAPPLSIRNARTGPNGKACLVTVTPSQITFQRFRDRTLDGPSGDSPAFVSYSQKETSVAYFDRGTPVRNPLRTNEATMAMR